MAGLLAWAADVVRTGGGATSEENESDSIPLIFNPEQEKYVRELNVKAAALSRSVQDLRQRIPPSDISQRLPDLHAHSLASNAALALQLNAHSSTKEQAHLRELTLLEENAAFEKAISDCEGKIQEKLREADELHAKLQEMDATLKTDLQVEQSAHDGNESDDSSSLKSKAESEARTSASISSLKDSLEKKKNELASMEEIVQNLERKWSKVQEESLKHPSPAQREKMLDKQLHSLLEQLAAKQGQAEGLVGEIHTKEMELERLNGLWKKVETNNAARNRFGRSNSDKGHNINININISSDYIVDPRYKSGRNEVLQRQMLLRRSIGWLGRLRRRFLWGGCEEKQKINWVAWKVVLGPKDKGGLGAGSLKSLNMALLFKWLWRFKSEFDTLWRQVINGIHNGNRKPIHALGKKTFKGNWFNIVSISSDLKTMGIDQNTIWNHTINSGNNTLLWLDNWEGSGNLALKFPNLYNLEKRKSCFISERFQNNIFSGSWKRNPNSLIETNELKDLYNILSPFHLSDGRDRWSYKLSTDGAFTVRDLRFIIDEKITTSVPNPTVWIQIIPLKIICFVWRACLGRIPTSAALSIRGINVNSTDCILCPNGIDEVNHILINCPSTKEVLDWIFIWCGLPTQYFSEVIDLVTFDACWGRCPKKRKLFVAICYSFLWCVWKKRNDRLFNNSITSTGKLKDNIALLVFDWVKNRGSFKNCNFAAWCNSPFDIL
ncbi:hypothetical protein LXL04_006430 [Taraxacum kok-saghyz]